MLIVTYEELKNNHFITTSFLYKQGRLKGTNLSEPCFNSGVHIVEAVQKTVSRKKHRGGGGRGKRRKVSSSLPSLSSTIRELKQQRF